MTTVFIPHLDSIRPLREIFDANKLDKSTRYEVIYGGNRLLQRRIDEEGNGATILAARLYQWTYAELHDSTCGNPECPICV